MAVVVAGARKMLEGEAGRSFPRNTHTTKVGPHIAIGPGALGYAPPAVIGVAETLCQPMPRPSGGRLGKVSDSPHTRPMTEMVRVPPGSSTNERPGPTRRGLHGASWRKLCSPHGPSSELAAG